MMASAQEDPRKAGTIWTLGPHDPLADVQLLLPPHIRRVESADLPALETAMGQSGEARRRLEGERQAYAAWVDGELAGYGWVSFEEEYIGELRLRLRLRPQEAYLWDCVTLPPYRRQHLYSALLAHAAADLRQAGIERIWIGADRDNLPSQGGIALAGFQHVADLGIKRVLAMRLVWVEGLAGVPEHLVAEARRAFLGERDQVWEAAGAGSLLG